MKQSVSRLGNNIELLWMRNPGRSICTKVSRCFTVDLSDFSSKSPTVAGVYQHLFSV